MKIIAALFFVHSNVPLTPLLTYDFFTESQKFLYVFINSVLIMKTRIWCARRYVEEIGSTAMLAAKRSAGVAPQANLRNM